MYDKKAQFSICSRYEEDISTKMPHSKQVTVSLKLDGVIIHSLKLHLL